MKLSEMQHGDVVGGILLVIDHPRIPHCVLHLSDGEISLANPNWLGRVTPTTLKCWPVHHVIGEVPGCRVFRGWRLKPGKASQRVYLIRGHDGEIFNLETGKQCEHEGPYTPLDYEIV